MRAGRVFIRGQESNQLRIEDGRLILHALVCRFGNDRDPGVWGLRLQARVDRIEEGGHIVLPPHEQGWDMRSIWTGIMQHTQSAHAHVYVDLTW